MSAANAHPNTPRASVLPQRPIVAPCVLPNGEEGCKRPRWNGSLLCAEHQGRLRRALRELPDHAATITALLGHTTAKGTDRVSGSRETPLPAASVLALTGPQAEADSHTCPEDQQDPTVLAQVGSWARDVEESLHLRPQTYPRSLVGLEMACATILNNFEAVCGLPQVDDLYDELTTLARNVRLAAGDQPQPQRGKVPCPVCSLRGLVSPEPGEPFVCSKRAGGCGATVTEADHDLLAEQMGSGFIKADAEHMAAEQAEVAAMHWRDSSLRHTPGSDEEREVRAHGADVRLADYLRAEAVWKAKGEPRNNRTQPDRSVA